VKFKIRFAEQIVGFFIILSLVSLVFVVVMLGRSQMWFAREVSFYTTLPSAGGLSRNMAIQYRGFTIGHIRNFRLVDDDVVVAFSILEEHRGRARLGSTVEMMTSPIGIGNQFLFHPGRGEELPDGAFVPALGSAEARELVLRGLAVEPQQDDGISVLMHRASFMFDEAAQLLAYVNEAFGPGTDATEIGQIAGSLRRTIEGLSAELVPIMGSINVLTAELADPGGEVYTSLAESLASISSILENLDRATAFVPAQLPQLAGLIMELRSTISVAEDVLVALTNNPLLRRGVPERPQSETGGISPRNIRF